MNTENDANQNLARAILKIRQENNLTQEQFAERTGTTRQAVSRWEMGTSVPNINTLVRISETFEISLDIMLKGETPPGLVDHTEGVAADRRNPGFPILAAGALGMISLPFLAKWLQIKNMEAFGAAYEHSYDYILEYPTVVILVLALLLIGVGACFIFKNGRKSNEKES